MEKQQLHMSVYRRLLEAVAVSAMMHIPEGRMERSSPIRNRDCRNVDPLCVFKYVISLSIQ